MKSLVRDGPATLAQEVQENTVCRNELSAETSKLNVPQAMERDGDRKILWN